MRSAVVLLMSLATLVAQDAGMTARQLYLQEAPRPSPLGPKKKEAPPPVALHLGLRYNLLKVNTASNATEWVDPDSNFRAGDCLAIQFRPNRNGYLYVFNLGSSGTWQTPPLMPSALMPDESNLVNAGTVRRVPENYCFMVRDPRGIDTLSVVLTEKQEDVYKLNDAIRKSTQPSAGRPPAGPKVNGIGDTNVALQPSDGDAVARLQTELVSRDLSIVRVGRSSGSDEPPNSVYAVRVSASQEERIVIEIKIRHD
jgi:hypothetical protein